MFFNEKYRYLTRMTAIVRKSFYRTNIFQIKRKRIQIGFYVVVDV